LEEAYAMCDDTIDSLIDLLMAMLAHGFPYETHGLPYEIKLPDEEFALFEGTGTGEIITSIIIFLPNQESVKVVFSRIIDECHGVSQGNKSK
jgi:hypothetical protein